MLDNTCVVDKANLGISKCTKLPELIKCMITTPDGFSCTDDEATDPTFWASALLADPALRIYLWPNFVEFADKSEAAVYESNALAYLPVRDGRYQLSFNISKDLCTHRKMFTHRAVDSGRVFFWDTANQLIGTRNADDTISGFQMQLLWTEKLIFNDGSKRTKSPIFVVLEDNTELDANGVIFDAAFLNTTPRLTDVNLAIATSPAPLSTGFTVDVATECDGTPIVGLLAADFILLKADGTTQTITSSTPDTNIPGRYRLAGTALVDGTLALRKPSLLTVKAYEGDIAILDI